MQTAHPHGRNPREGGDPVRRSTGNFYWIPACAGISAEFQWAFPSPQAQIERHQASALVEEPVPRQPAECETMDEVRAEIDRIDAALVDLVAERFGFVERAWQLKSRPEEATVPWRIQQVIDRVRAKAKERGLPPELAEALWRQMIGWFIQYEEEKLQARNAGQP
jgi:isochorismate pyruvate lyase